MTRHSALILVLAACDISGDGDDQEVITTVELTFTPTGGTAVTATFEDLDGDGGAAPTSDPINLANGATYTAALRFLNKLETTPEDITLEVNDESDQHQVFFTGSAVNGPASDRPSAPLTHAYADVDANGLPIGLSNTITAAAGTGTLTVTLRHLPLLNGVAVKTADLATQIKNGVTAIPEIDAKVDFMVTVQ